MDYLNFRKTDKKSLSEFNLEEIRGWMIGRMTQVEMKIDTIISDYFQPQKKSEFEKIILNSSILSMGGKMKVLRNVKGFDKNTISKIQKIASIRNAFAHIPLYESVDFIVMEDKKGKHIDSNLNVTSLIEVMNSNGELKVQNSKEQFQKFFELQKEIIEYLNNFNNT